jgi:hypothetical protein
VVERNCTCWDEVDEAETLLIKRMAVDIVPVTSPKLGFCKARSNVWVVVELVLFNRVMGKNALENPGRNVTVLFVKGRKSTLATAVPFVAMTTLTVFVPAGMTPLRTRGMLTWPLVLSAENSGALKFTVWAPAETDHKISVAPTALKILFKESTSEEAQHRGDVLSMALC